MKEISLSTKELLVLASHVGAENFYGIKDPFCGMSRQEIEASILEVQLALEQKGYATVGFDSSFQVMPNIEAVILVCAQCDKYIMIDVVSTGNRIPKQMLYFCNGQCIKLEQATEELSLSQTTAQTFIDDIMGNFFGDCCEDENNIASVSLPKSVLDAARAGNLEDGKALLQSHGCVPAVASVITEGLHQRCSYISIVGVDLKNHVLDALICIVSPSAAVSMRLNDLGDQDQWRVSWLSRKKLAQILRQIIRDSEHRGGTENALL